MLLTVHLSTILANNKLDTLFQCIYFTQFPPDRHTRQSPTQSDVYQMMY
jgi:hypothetical protein